jgi:hypothetical protein
MPLEVFAQHCRLLIDNKGWGKLYRLFQLLLAGIILILLAFTLSYFDSWTWGQISIGFVPLLILETPFAGTFS